MRRVIGFFALFTYLLFSYCGAVYAESPPQLPLAHTYERGINLDDYWVSEKLDGVRAYWNGNKLISRQGNVYHAPKWFIADFPSRPLDGELWLGRSRFAELLSVVRDHTPGPGWREVRYMVFDIPVADVSFTERIKKIKRLCKKSDSPYLEAVAQFKIDDHTALMKRLNKTVDAGGEGLMLHKGDSYYRGGRSHDLLKVKTYQDAEARVIAHLPGKGKYKGMLGSLLVETEDGRRFRLGTGFSDRERRNPPPVGALVTYKYYGKTRHGLPRFASFLRIRHE